MQQVVRAFPVLDGQQNDMERFLKELRDDRKDETDAFYKRYGVVRETAYLQATATGTFLIVVTDIDDADKHFAAYGASQAEFEAWFKGRVKTFSGINLDETPKGPQARRVHDWSRTGVPLET
jgi:hypothetical protein